MKTAHLSLTRLPVTVEQYVDAYGPKLDARAQPRTRPEVICLACNSAMHTVGEDLVLRDATWAHNPSKNWCPVKEASGNPYKILEPTEIDVEVGKALRASFFRNWKLHWAVITSIVPMCDIYTLISFLQRCDKLNFWNQVGLQEWYIPYVFLASCDFPPPKGKGARVRPQWLRCRLDSRVRDSRDLWIRTEGDWGFLLLTYKAPRSGEPNAGHFLHMEEIVKRPNFLTELAPKANSFQEKAMSTAFTNELL